MILRFAEQNLRAKLATSPAVVLLGPRQVGKTTTARRLARNWSTETLYLDLERPADRRRLDDADAYLRRQQGKLVSIDEIHRVPGLFEILRGIIDDRRAAGERPRRPVWTRDFPSPAPTSASISAMSSIPDRNVIHSVTAPKPCPSRNWRNW